MALAVGALFQKALITPETKGIQMRMDLKNRHLVSLPEELRKTPGNTGEQGEKGLLYGYFCSNVQKLYRSQYCHSWKARNFFT